MLFDMDGRHKRDVAFLAPLAAGTLFVFYLVWAAMHDIAHGESDCTLEYAALVTSIPAFAFLYRMALLFLPAKAKVVWLGGTGLVVVLFDIAAINVRVHPKYEDPMLASLFLMVGVPVLMLIAYHLVSEAFRLRLRARH